MTINGNHGWSAMCSVSGDSNRYQYAISFKLSDENARIKVMQIAKATYKNGKYVYEPTQITNWKNAGSGEMETLLKYLSL